MSPWHDKGCWPSHWTKTGDFEGPLAASQPENPPGIQFLLDLSNTSKWDGLWWFMNVDFMIDDWLMIDWWLIDGLWWVDKWFIVWKPWVSCEPSPSGGKDCDQWHQENKKIVVATDRNHEVQIRGLAFFWVIQASFSQSTFSYRSLLTSLTSLMN